MAGDWIKFEIGTPDKPEVWAIAMTLGIDPDAVVGKLMRVWSWFDQHTESGNAPSVTKMLLDRLVGVTGFCDAVVESGWMIEDGDGLSLPNFGRHNGKTAKKRAVTAKRVAAHKERKRSDNAKGNAGDVTEELPREEKRRSTSSSTAHGREVLPMAPGWQPGEQFQSRATMAGIPPGSLTPEILGEFKSYWLTRPDEMTHSQWEHKLLQALQARRNRNANTDAGKRSSAESDAVRNAIRNTEDRSWAAGLG